MFPADEQEDEDNPAPQTFEENNARFFLFIGGLCTVFGAAIVLFDIMHSAVLSALAAILFLFIGGGCTMVGFGHYFRDHDEKHIINAKIDGE